MHSKAMVRGALLIALALVLQSIRIVLPMPQLLSTFVIGTLVHMMMILTLKVVGLPTAFLLGLLLPMSAYLQGQILLPFLIPVVWVGNLLFIFLIYWLGENRKLAIVMPAACKAVLMCVAAWLIVSFVQIPSVSVQRAVIFAMSVPQFITGVIGVMLSYRIMLSIHKIM